ncbi:gamma carbonic anhydrase family protein [Paenibacillus wulumuqiensis]|uniref:gamma carbonic anhydrase family protein n=1 Tax=Paenibacillus wulumuqiensis TaxID=1567107 RepID=UPI00061952EB|nr:gamma carbonic anhydrase family protein [Paenibacillus wulumuqiensis]
MLLPYHNQWPIVHKNTFIAEGAKLIGDVKLGEDSSVWFNTVLRGDLAPVIIGDRCNVQDLAVGHVHEIHPLIIENDVSVGHSAIVHGCRIGQGSLIGMGAILLNGVEVGEYSLIGAGSIVTENNKIPPYTLALGSPARVIRELTEADLQRMARTTQSYVDKGREFRNP